MGIIKLYNKITIEIDNRTNPAQVNMKVEHEMPLPQLMVILHSLQGQLMQQMMTAAPSGPPPAPPAGELPKVS